ncbi:30S ribosomal protein S16 [Candidatus Margulisiibacteriota bacterium]
MAAKIRLARTGSKKRPYYRVVVVDSRNAGDSNYIEILGQYNPLLEKDQLNVDKDKVLNWIKEGAEPSFTVRKLLGKAGIMKALDLASLPKRLPKAQQKAAEAGEAAPKAEGAPKEGEKKEAPKKEEAPKADLPAGKAEKKEAPKEEKKEAPKEEKAKEEKKEAPKEEKKEAPKEEKKEPEKPKEEPKK